MSLFGQNTIQNLMEFQEEWEVKGRLEAVVEYSCTVGDEDSVFYNINSIPLIRKKGEIYYERIFSHRFVLII
jgi:hypothetical protein